MKDNQKKQNIIKAFGKIFSTKKNNDKTDIPPEERVGFMDPCNVAMVVPKTSEYKAIIESMFDVRQERIPDLNFSGNGRSKFSGEYLAPLLELAKNQEYVYLEVMKDYPLRAETEDFIYIVAPRVEND